MRRVWTMMSLAVVLALTTACGAAAGGAGEDLAERKVRVVTTTGMVADLAENVGGERVEVTALMGPGVDPHLYTASEGDVRLLEEADLILYNGLHLEAQMARVLEQMDGQGRRTVAVAEQVDQGRILEPDPEFGEADEPYDPHIWFDVELWMQAAEVVRDTLIELDPAHEDIYRANAERYLAELRELHEYVLEQAGRVPQERRVLITAHDAFNYFGRAYGFEVRGLQGISTVTEAGAADVQKLAEFIVERQIPAVFIETTVPDRPVRALQEAVRARGHEVTIGGQLFSDAMGDPGTPEGTYIGMMRHNIDTVVSALLADE